MIEFGRERDAVHQLEARDFADHLAFTAVHHVHFGAVRDEDAARARIGDQVIPEAIAWNADLLDEMVTALRGGNG